MWLSQCPACARWNTIIAGLPVAITDHYMATPRPAPLPRSPQSLGVPGPLPLPFAQVSPIRSAPTATPLSAALLAEAQTRRIETGISELDRVLGGGLVDGSVVLIGADPGQGKSTLALQLLAALTERAAVAGALYVSGEESVHQIALRADRLGLLADGRISVRASDDVDAAIEIAGKTASLALVVDSIQTMRTSDLDAPPGSVAQVGACAAKLARFAKDTLTPVIIIGQVTKTGEIAGPKTLEHLVDVVLYLEAGRGAERLLTSPKNRHGSTAEVGTLAMGPAGLSCVTRTSRDYLAERAAGVPGSAVFPAASGDRVSRHAEGLDRGLRDRRQARRDDPGRTGTPRRDRRVGPRRVRVGHRRREDRRPRRGPADRTGYRELGPGPAD